ncbi:MAG: DUF167 domain-containing protein [Candidatus Omnitrophica bacterium]|nr:DUF167 domain-containing protein [Candidatus Omnitrophota bacterium]MBU1047563.1 DUF167 domain-containing protein [Candidatus Omnitrophota bacterium]MBU1630493.1 DUF167 domain-containing protein [Candidatus Omnitrophota bacterium]MBU1888926.1 DUF167 domain-containing protein [Candidatus Omnitrophota bacterium]
MLIKVKVTTNSKKEEVIQKSPDSFQIKVKAKPIEGQANKAVTEALASFLKLPIKKIRLVRGSKTRNKLFEVELHGLTPVTSASTPSDLLPSRFATANLTEGTGRKSKRRGLSANTFDAKSPKTSHRMR